MRHSHSVRELADGQAPFLADCSQAFAAMYELSLWSGLAGWVASWNHDLVRSVVWVSLYSQGGALKNLQRVTGASHPRAVADAERAAQMPEFQRALAEADATAARVVRRRRARFVSGTLCASVLLIIGGCLAVSGGGDARGAIPVSSERVHLGLALTPPATDALQLAIATEASKSLRLRALAHACMQADLGAQSVEWRLAAIGVVARSGDPAAEGWIAPLLVSRDRDVAYSAATWIKAVRPDWRGDQELRERIEQAIANYGPTEGL